MKDLINSLTSDQLLDLREMITAELFNSMQSEYSNQDSFRAQTAAVSKSLRMVKARKGIQKYKCKDCNKTRVITRNKLIFSSKKDFSQWDKFIESLLDRDSLKVSCIKASISKSTAFRWRIKVLKALSMLMNQDVLDGIRHLDETLVNKVFKNKIYHVKILTTKKEV